MIISQVTQVAYAGATLVSAIFALILIYRSSKNKFPLSLCVAAIIQTAWLAVIATRQTFDENALLLLFQMEILHFVAWVFAITRTTETLCSKCLPKAYRLIVYCICFIGVSAFITTFLIQIDAEHIEKAIHWQGILLSITGLVAVEQLYRSNTTYRVLKLICLVMAAVFLFDAYTFTQNLLLGELNEQLIQTRAALLMAACALMTVGLITLVQPTEAPANINFSRPVIFYTTSLSLAGLLLMVLSFGGYYVQLYGGNWGSVIYTVIFAVAVFAIIAVLSSREIREKLTVLINKHLFNYKYDYRAEWINLINRLSQEGDDTPATRSIKTAAELFKCSGGALWLKRARTYALVQQHHCNFDATNAFENEDTDFCRALKDEWVFSPRSMAGDLSLHNELLPEWVKKSQNVWLIFPLLTEKKLVGFMLLTSTENLPSLNWEDLDLIKTVGRQFASYMTRHEQEEQLTEVRQFDTFNKLSAFVMHDLKNLIAQQSLVVKNAEKHKDNPAFVEDAINTINNSVERMNNLLRKLQHNEPDHAKTLTMKDVLVEAIKRCQKTLPVPTLLPIDKSIKVTADFDSLVMVFTHIIHNAQDATQNNGFIDVTTTSEGKSVTITIEDNGQGMDNDFIQNKLFKPFETTKAGKGMGVGVYQAREYITSIGGSIQVSSTVSVGTTFTICIPVTL